MQLKVATSREWVELAVREFDAVLIDHAHCEKKAAANALSLLQLYPDVPGLPAKMARLAREEASHLARVLGFMEKRGLVLGRDDGDPYAQGLVKLVRHGQRERRLDRLLVAGIIEGRSFERLQLLAEALSQPELKKFYAELGKSEDGHRKLFVKLACAIEDEAVVLARLDELLEGEAELIRTLPIRAAVH